MFNNYKKYYDNYTKYLMSLEAQMNTNDMGSGFAVVETFIMVNTLRQKKKWHWLILLL